jgi:hypothetical protein
MPRVAPERRGPHDQPNPPDRDSMTHGTVGLVDLPRYKSWPNPSSLNGDCLIYVIGEQDGPYKVGIGHDPENRLIQLQAGNPRTLRPHGEWDVRPWAVRVESGAHLILKPHHVTREWFSADLDTCIGAVLTSARDIADQVEAATGKRPYDL